MGRPEIERPSRLVVILLGLLTATLLALVALAFPIVLLGLLVRGLFGGVAQALGQVAEASAADRHPLPVIGMPFA
jgi:flagellar biosynthesis protein FliR